MLGSISQVCCGLWGAVRKWLWACPSPGPLAAPLPALCLRRPCRFSLRKRTSHQDGGRPLGAQPVLSLILLSTGKKSSAGLTAGCCNWDPGTCLVYAPNSLGNCPLLQGGVRGFNPPCRSQGVRKRGSPPNLPRLPPQGCESRVAQYDSKDNGRH